MVEKIIYLILYLTTEVINYLLAYSIVFEMNVVKRKSNWIIGTVIIIVVHLIVCFLGDSTMSRSMSIFSMVIVPVCFVVGKMKRKVILYPIVVMVVGSIVTSATYVISVCLNLAENLIVDSPIWIIVCQGVPIIFMLIISIYRKVKNYERIQVKLDYKQYALQYVGVICSFFILASIQKISKREITDRVINYYGISVSMACVIMIFLIIRQGIVAKRELQYKKQSELYDIYMKLQEERIKEVIEQDEKMRRFRHDINKHFVALNGYAQDNKNDKIKEYLKDMIDSACENELKEYTGNKALDAVIRQIEEQAISRKINISIASTKIVNEKVAVFDLCTIISNTMNNAIEACEKIEESANRKIEVSLLGYESKLYIIIKNTTLEKVMVKDERLVTTKSDKRNHGLGSGNVERTVKKYEGLIEYKCENGWFEVEIII